MQNFQTAGQLERRACWREHLGIAADGSCRNARNGAFAAKMRFDRVAAQAFTPDGPDVLVQIARVEQFADEEAHASCCVEMVHVG